jgi:hypothetical protein
MCDGRVKTSDSDGWTPGFGLVFPISEPLAEPLRHPPVAGREGRSCDPKSHSASEPLDLAVLSVALRVVGDLASPGSAR